jgi:hypothetical protein
MTHPTGEQLNDYLERELSPADHVEVSRHVETCPDCALVIAELQQILRDAASLAPITPPVRVWTEIESQLRASQDAVVEAQRGAEAQGAKAAGDRRSLTARWGRWRLAHWGQWRPTQWGRWQPTRWGPAWALATAALVIVAFLTGRIVEHRARPSAAVTSGAAQAVVDPTAAANVRERVLLVAVGDHLERSQMVLVELANAHTRDALDISAERQSADELLASNRLYRQTAAQIGQTGVADLLDDLERVLVEVANGPSQVSMQQLAAIQQRIEAQGILFKVKIIGSDIRERGNSTSAGRKQPVS